MISDVECHIYVILYNIYFPCFCYCDKMLMDSNLKGKRFIWLMFSQRFQSTVTGEIVSEPVVQQDIRVKRCGREKLPISWQLGQTETDAERLGWGTRCPSHITPLVSCCLQPDPAPWSFCQPPIMLSNYKPNPLMRAASSWSSHLPEGSASECSCIRNQPFNIWAFGGHFWSKPQQNCMSFFLNKSDTRFANIFS